MSLQKNSSRKSYLVLCAPILVVVFALSLTGCKPRQSADVPSESTPPQSTPNASPLTGFARDLQFIKNGQYKYVFVFARKDGKPIDKDDAAYLRENAPQVVDWVTTDTGKRVIAGTNFNLQEGGLDKLKKRFVVEDYSGK